MAHHRLAPYQVRIHKPFNTSELLPFGNFQGDGKWLGDLISNALAAYELQPEEGAGADELGVTYEQPIGVEDRKTVGATFLTSYKLPRHSIHDSDGNHAYDVRSGDQGRYRVGALFSLPANRDIGRLLMHVPSNRGIKTGLEAHLRKWVREHTDLILQIDAATQPDMLALAIQTHGLDKVILKKFAPTKTDEFEKNVGAFGGEEEVGSVEVHVNARRGPHHLVPTRVSKFLESANADTWSELVTFQGLTFDDVRVTAKHPATGRPKMWTLKGPGGGHPVQQDLEIDDDDQLGLAAVTVEKALLEAVETA